MRDRCVKTDKTGCASGCKTLATSRETFCQSLARFEGNFPLLLRSLRVGTIPPHQYHPVPARGLHTIALAGSRMHCFHRRRPRGPLLVASGGARRGPRRPAAPRALQHAGGPAAASRAAGAAMVVRPARCAAAGPRRGATASAATAAPFTARSSSYLSSRLRTAIFRLITVPGSVYWQQCSLKASGSLSR